VWDLIKRYKYSAGPLPGRLVVIAHAPRDEGTRIISMRKGNRREQESIKSDLARIDQMKDAEINYSDIPPLDKSFLKRATTAWPRVKKQLTIRLDADVLAWLKAQGRGYQTRINRILRVVMESQPPAPLGEIRSQRLPTRETSKPGTALGGNRARAR